MTESQLKAYPVDFYFRCDHKARLYKLLDRLKDLALSFKARKPYPVYLGEGNFQVAWDGGRAEIQDTTVGIARLWTTSLTKSQYDATRQVFWDYWNENYSIGVQDSIKDTGRFKKKLPDSTSGEKTLDFKKSSRPA